MDFLILNLALLSLCVFLLLILSMVWPPDSPWAPWWRTGRKIAIAICRLGNVTKKDTVYDLGSGDGTALLTAAKEFGASGVGIEIDPLRAAIAKARIRTAKLQDKIRIIRQNFFNVPISDSSVIFVYLVPKALLRLKKKFLSELKPGTRIVSYRYEIPYLPLAEKDEVHQLYLYTIPKNDSNRETRGSRLTSE